MASCPECGAGLALHARYDRGDGVVDFGCFERPGLRLELDLERERFLTFRERVTLEEVEQRRADDEWTILDDLLCLSCRYGGVQHESQVAYGGGVPGRTV